MSQNPVHQPIDSDPSTVHLRMKICSCELLDRTDWNLLSRRGRRWRFALSCTALNSRIGSSATPHVSDQVDEFLFADRVIEAQGHEGVREGLHGSNLGPWQREFLSGAV